MLRQSVIKVQRKIIKAVDKNSKAIVKLNAKYDAARQFEKNKQTELDVVAVTKAEWTL